MIALAISIYGAFNVIGENKTAHDLGTGLLLSWLPILVLSTITDRNPVAADEILQQLNNLLDLVRTALLDSERRESYIKTIGKTENDFTWIKFLEDDRKGFFTQFAGQGRVRWHVGDIDTSIDASLLTDCQHGCANSILSSVEHAWIADHGRGWMDNPDYARTQIISGVEPNHRELVWFDRQMFRQIAASTALFYGTAGGAFILACEETTYSLPVLLSLIGPRLHSHSRPRLLVWWLSHLYCRCKRHLCARDVTVVVPSDISKCAAMDAPFSKEPSLRSVDHCPLWTCTPYFRSPKQRSLGDWCSGPASEIAKDLA